MTACYLTLLLVIEAGGSDPIPSLENPIFEGDCLIRSGQVSLYVSPFSKELVITREFDMFRIALPTRPGSYQFRYIFGRDTADVWPEGEYPVRKGPIEMY